MTLLRLGVLLLPFVSLACSGTGGGGSGTITPEETALAEVCDLIRSVTGTTGRPPTKVGDFAKYESQYPSGHKAVKSGDVVVLWGVGVAGEGNAASAQELIV